MADTVELIVDCRNQLGESPVWNERDMSLYWVDVTASALHAFTPGDGTLRRWDLGEYPGSFAFRADPGSLVMAFRRGLARVDLNVDGAIAIDRIVDPMIDLARGRFNDGACDQQGRFWVGQMDRHGRDPAGFLYRLDADGAVHRMDGGVTTGNGVAFSPDGKTMYFVDTHPALVYAYDFDPDDGVNFNKRIFLDLRGSGGRPDGCTVDAEGCLWLAEIGAGRIGRYRPDGILERHISMPTPMPTSLAFGGADLDTLYVTSLWMGMSLRERNEQPLSGALFAVRPGVSGRPEPLFAG